MTHAATIPVPVAKEPLPDIRNKDSRNEPALPGFALKNLNFRKLLLTSAALVVLAMTPAHAELTLCNRTSYRVEAALRERGLDVRETASH